MRPLLNEFTVTMPRGAAVVYPKDAAQILMGADIFPGARVIEAGAGSGALTLRPAAGGRRHRPADLVRAARGLRRDRPPQRGRTSSARRTRPGICGSATWCEQPSTERARRPGRSSTCWLPGSASTPWPRCWCPGGVLCCYVATTTQLGRTVETLRAHSGFTEPEATESLVRAWHVEGLAVRPRHDMVGHTGFLITARRLAPGVGGTAAQASPGARRVWRGLHLDLGMSPGRVLS